MKSLRFLVFSLCLLLGSCTPILAQTQAITISVGTKRVQQTTIKMPSSSLFQVESGGTLTVSGALSGTPTGGTLSFANLTFSLGTPGSGTLTNCTGLPISTGVSGLGTGVGTFLGTPTSANLAAAITNETGSGALVFATSPTLVTPTLGVATATSVNGLTITSSTGTLTIANGKTLTASNSITIAGTDGSSLNVGAGGTLGSAAFVSTASLYGPAFRAVRSADLSMTGSWTLDNFAANTVIFDTDSCYNTGTGRFTPNKAGYYRLHVQARVNGTALAPNLRLNGSTYWSSFVGSNALSGIVDVVVYLNGSTDYVDALMASPTPGDLVVHDEQYSWFEANFVRP